MRERALRLGSHFCAKPRVLPTELRDAYDQAQFYRLEPQRIALIDNTRGLGFKETIEFAPNA